MKTFHVPQFIEVEDKIFGPLTLKQFIYLLGGGGAVFILWVFLPLFFAILLGAPVIFFALALAFYKVNNQSFIKILSSAISYSAKSRLYLWKKRGRKKKFQPSSAGEGKKAQPMLTPPKLSESKLKDLAWSLDVNEKLKDR